MEDNRPTEVNIAALGERVTSIESNVVALRTSLDSIASKLESRLSPQWGVYFSGLALVFAITVSLGTLALQPTQTRIAELEQTDARFRADYMRTDVFKESQERVFDAVNRLEKDLTSLDTQFSIVAPATLALDDIKKRLDRIEGLRLRDPDVLGAPK